MLIAKPGTQVIKKDKKQLMGESLLDNPMLNKSTAFSLKERIRYQLLGLLPSEVETLEQQLIRTKFNFDKYQDPIQQHIFLRALQDRNEVLFYRFLMENIETTLPIIYTPTVGLACQQFSRIYRKARGVYLSYSEKDHIETTLKNIKRQRQVKVIVITDGERILGLGDQGIGGLGISIGKLSLYTLCGGIHPNHTLPIVIDVGTNNQELLKDPTYLGHREPRLQGEEYANFLDHCIQSIKKVFPNVLLQFEDFAQDNAHFLLNTYQNQLCCFNDDIQGTAAIAAASILAAIFKLKANLSEQKICVFGAGSAGCGIADLLVKILINQGVPKKQAYANIYLVDICGLLHDKMTQLKVFQRPFCQDHEKIDRLFRHKKVIHLESIIDTIQPQILVGVSGQKDAFNEHIIRKMSIYCPHPIIFPLSNPNDKAEATPDDIFTWTQGRAIVATGSPFPYSAYQGQPRLIAQCNNSYIFPAMGLAILSGQIKHVTSKLFETAAIALAKQANSQQLPIDAPILPPLATIRQVSFAIAEAVLHQAILDQLSSLDPKSVKKTIKTNFWIPSY